MSWKNNLRDYAIVAVISLLIFSILSLYIFERRGYYNLYIMNKVLAGTSLILLCIVLLIGPLCGFSNRFTPWLTFRKELGVILFFLALFHSVVSLFFLPDKFPLLYFLNEGLVSFVFGLSSIILLAFIAIISNDFFMNKLGAQRWWFIQRWGARISFILIFLHFTIIKYKGWIKFFEEGGGKDLARPYLLPASFIAFVISVILIIVRIIDIIRNARKK